eukprot:7207424-Lingulodinium_polyedra.AAC.1
MHGEFQDWQLLRDCYISIESLRKSLDVIHHNLLPWIEAKLSFREPMGADWVAGQKALWHALGVEAEATLLLASTLEYEFSGGRLWVSRAAANTPFLTSVIHDCLKATWRFLRWSDSRWLTVGICSRILVAALAMGVEDHVDFICQGERPNLFYLQGFKRLDTRGKNFMVQASLVSR